MFFRSSYGRVYYELYGSQNSTAIAFTHGLGCDHRMYQNQISEFKDGYRVLVWDMPDHGKSVKLQREFTFSVAATCFVELLDEIGLENAVLVGSSLGGYVSQYIAARYPYLVKGVHIDSCHPLGSNFNKLAVLGVHIHSAVTKMLPLEASKFLIKKLLTTDRHSREYMEVCTSQGGKEKLIHLSEGIKQGIIEGIDKPLPHPVLITNGEDELVFIRTICSHWHKNHPNSEYVVIPGVGHSAVLDRPQKFNQALQSLLQKIEGERG